jgi:hypothetical protein
MDDAQHAALVHLIAALIRAASDPQLARSEPRASAGEKPS